MVDRYRGAVRGERERGALADAGGGPGDQRATSFEQSRGRGMEVEVVVGHESRPTRLSCLAMPYFKDAEEVYANLGKLFEDIIADDDLRSRFQRADTVFQYRMRRPDSQVTVKALEADDPQVEFGITKLQPEVVLAMDADTAHRFWLGKVNVTVALARGEISARGPVAKILKLVPLVKPVQTRYESQLEAAGRSDLAQA
jgi:hypothetical protein